jgi:hypothetical protein
VAAPHIARTSPAISDRSAGGPAEQPAALVDELLIGAGTVGDGIAVLTYATCGQDQQESGRPDRLG